MNEQADTKYANINETMKVNKVSLILSWIFGIITVNLLVICFSTKSYKILVQSLPNSITNSISTSSLPNSITDNIKLSKQDNYRLELVYSDSSNKILVNQIDKVNNDIYKAPHFHGKAIISKSKVLDELHGIINSSKYYNYSYGKFNFYGYIYISSAIIFGVLFVASYVSRIVSNNKIADYRFNQNQEKIKKEINERK